jgi:molecular chaperone GrpE
MSRDETFPRSLAEEEEPDSGDVEILEILGVDEWREPVLGEAPSRPLDTEDEPGDILLGFEDDAPEPEAESAAPTAPAEPETLEPAALDPTDRDALLRLRADYENLRKRITRERREFELHANSALVGRLLPVLDNLERAMATDTGAAEYAAIREGLAMIHRQLTDELRREGLRALETVGQMFDPNLHDAVATEPRSDLPANTILEEFQRGYLFQDKVLRHAMVRVSTAEPGFADFDDDEVSR